MFHCFLPSAEIIAGRLAHDTVKLEKHTIDGVQNADVCTV